MRPAPTRSELSKHFERLLPNAAQLTHFVTIYFAETASQFSNGMTRLDRINLLFADLQEADLFEALRMHFPNDVDLSLSRGSTYGEALSSALGLDRTEQFATIKELSPRAACTVFLLYGQAEQAGLLFFRERIRTYLPNELKRAGKGIPRVVTVPLTAFGLRATSGPEWGVRIKDALARALGLFGTADELLGKANAMQPLLLILGQYPFDDDNLTESDWSALDDFISTWLPERLHGKSFVHTLITYEYKRLKQSRVSQLAATCRRGQLLRSSFIFQQLPEAHLPTWHDALRFLMDNSAHSPLPAERIATLHVGFEQIRKKKSYEMIANLLDI